MRLILLVNTKDKNAISVEIVTFYCVYYKRWIVRCCWNRADQELAHTEVYDSL